MEEQLITEGTAKLAKEKGINIVSDKGYYMHGTLEDFVAILLWCSGEPNKPDFGYAPTQSLLQRFIREERGVHIEVQRNASGYYWSMCRADGGTDLGWSEYRGANHAGVWDSFEDALEDALYTQMSFDLPKNTEVIRHWGNYVDFAVKHKK